MPNRDEDTPKIWRNPRYGIVLSRLGMARERGRYRHITNFNVLLQKRTIDYERNRVK